MRGRYGRWILNSSARSPLQYAELIIFYSIKPREPEPIAEQTWPPISHTHAHPSYSLSLIIIYYTYPPMVQGPLVKTTEKKVRFNCVFVFH